MAYILMIIGALLVYFGSKRKIAADKPIGGMTAGELGKAGFSGYLKIMMIVGGICFILFGLIIKLLL